MTTLNAGESVAIYCPICKVNDPSISLDANRSSALFDRNQSPPSFEGWQCYMTGSCGHEWQILAGRLDDSNPEAFVFKYGIFSEAVDYHAYIKSVNWKAIADEAKRLAGYRCRVCNRHASGVTLDAHHRTYERLGNESLDDITVLCRGCHTLYESDRKQNPT